MDYKKIFKSRKTRAKVLHVLRFIPDKAMIKLQYRIKTGRTLDLKTPKRYSEKLQWYKLYYRNPVMRQCVNKHAVRKYVIEKGLEHILVPQYAHYKWAEDVEWSKLPNSFVIKTQHGGGGLSVVLVKDKNATSKDEVISKLIYEKNKVEGRTGGREWAYWNIPTGVVIEQLLINHENPDAGINDYKFFCYQGIAKYIIVDVDRFIGHKRNFYDRDWNNLHVTSDCPASDREIKRPKNLDEMISVAEKLSEDFPYVRVDLYSVEGKIYFGELTFYPWSGYVQFNPDEWDFKFAEDFELIRFR